DGVEPAQPLDDLDGRLVYQAETVPQHVAGRRPQQQRALSDGEIRSRADADESRLELPEAVAMVAAERLERRPVLTRARDELAIVGADRAVARRLVGHGELQAAGRANGGGAQRPGY